jgi:hypothetical protein
MIASAWSTAQLVQTARRGAGILGPGTPAAARLENIALAIAMPHCMACMGTRTPLRTNGYPVAWSISLAMH